MLHLFKYFNVSNKYRILAKRKVCTGGYLVEFFFRFCMERAFLDSSRLSINKTIWKKLELDYQLNKMPHWWSHTLAFIDWEKFKLRRDIKYLSMHVYCM